MRLRLCLALITGIFLQASSGTLAQETEELLQRLLARGYSVARQFPLYLSVDEPVEIPVYLPASLSEGFVIGLGGNYVLDLGLRLDGTGWTKTDTIPDDYPVLSIDRGYASSLRSITVTALDMTHGRTEDSVIVLMVLKPVDPDTLE